MRLAYHELPITPVRLRLFEEELRERAGGRTEIGAPCALLLPPRLITYPSHQIVTGPTNQIGLRAPTTQDFWRSEKGSPWPVRPTIPAEHP